VFAGHHEKWATDLPKPTATRTMKLTTLLSGFDWKLTTFL